MPIHSIAQQKLRQIYGDPRRISGYPIGMQTTTATVHSAVYHEDPHAAVNLVYDSHGQALRWATQTDTSPERGQK